MPEKRLQRTRESYITGRCWLCAQPVVLEPGQPWPKYDLKYDMWMCSPEHVPSGVADERDYVDDVREAEESARDIIVRAALRQDKRVEMAIRAAEELRRVMFDVGPRVLK